MDTYVNQLIKQWQWQGFLLLGYGKRWTIQVHADVFIIILLSLSPFSIRILRLKVVNIFGIHASDFKRKLILNVFHVMYIYAVFIVPLK